MVIYKEKKEKDFRMVLFPMGRNKIGLGHVKNFAIVLYLKDDEYDKLGRLILLTEEFSDEEIFEDIDGADFSKKYFNVSSYKKILTDYNLITLNIIEEKYSLLLYKKESGGFVAFKDDLEYIFENRPAFFELGKKVMEMFEFKEKYDEE